MKMLKRALMLTFILVVLCAASAFADVGGSIPEDFESYRESETITDVESGIFTLRDSRALTVLPTGGKDGTVGVQYEDDWASNKAISAKNPSNLGDDYILEMSFDLKATYPKDAAKAENTLATDNIYGGSPLIKIVYDETYGGAFQSAVSESESVPYDDNEWYRVIIRQTSGGKRIATIVDSSGNLVIEVEKSVAASKPLVAIFVRAGGSYIKVAMDNFLLTHYDSAVNKPSFASGNISDEADGILRNSEFVLNFDQEISASSVVTIAKAVEGSDPIPVAGVTVTRPVFNQLKAKLPEGVLLDRKSKYIIDLSGVTNGTLASVDSISFTTEDLHLWNDITNISAEENDADNTLTDITFTIGDEYGYPRFSGSVMAVVYQDGKMINVDIQPLTNVAAGELTKSFSLGTLPSEANVGIILLDLEAGPIPLAGGMLEN